jgi:CRISPR-associated protein Cas1
MKRLLNTLYVTNPDSYLGRDGETIEIRIADEIKFKIPILNLESIVCFGYMGMSPALMRLCVERDVGVSFMSPTGRFLARINGPVKGNVLLRKAQFETAIDENRFVSVARDIITGKIINAREVLLRGLRDHAAKIEESRVRTVVDSLGDCVKKLQTVSSADSVRGIEGEAAERYFSVLDELIVTQKEFFKMNGRNRRPPLDRFNALLSFLYALLYSNVTGALETVGLDPAVGFMHRFRSGRNSLALDMIEELRPYLADRLALTLVNRNQIKPKDFTVKENGAVLLNDDGRKLVLDAWQTRKRDTITHPFLNEKLEIGLIPYVQSMLLARHIRGDIDAYPPFLMKDL